MCGRYSLNVDPEKIQQLEGYDASVSDWERKDVFVPRYNIAPHTQAPVIRRRNAELVMSTMKWGLVPHYCKFEDKSLSTFNARAEKLVQGGGMWASLKGPKRCAVMCQGYYEWYNSGKEKLPHFVKPKDGRLMILAGLYDSVVLEGQTETLWSFTIVTTAMRSELAWLHDRQPVILHTAEALDAWLDASQQWTQDLVRFLMPTTCALECYQVPKEVGKPGNESPAFIEPIPTPKDDTIQKDVETASGLPSADDNVDSATTAVNAAHKLKLDSGQILIYQTLIACLQEACRAGISRRTPSDVARLQATLDGYVLPMTQDAVVAIVKSLECRRTLLELSSDLGLGNDPKIRAALRADEERMAALLVSIFTSEASEAAVLRLEGDSAQCFLDVVQSTLDKGFLIAQEHSRMAQRAIRKLSAACDRLPSSLFIEGVVEKEDHPLFGGGYGDIYRAKHNGRTVALKYMRAVHFLRGADLRQVRLKFCSEALVWKDLRHPNILPFLGIEKDCFPSSLCMVSPWMEHGTVISYVKDHGHANIDKLLYEIAQGLEYLHSCGIVHGDLRGSNVLIDENWNACLADFGLSIFSDATATMTTTRAGSIHWMAPELLDPDSFGDGKFARTAASDVYAFGCLCLELYTGQPPFAQLREPAAMMKVLNGERPERPSGTPTVSNTRWLHVTACWAQKPAARPKTRVVVQNMAWPVSATA